MSQMQRVLQTIPRKDVRPDFKRGRRRFHAQIETAHGQSWGYGFKRGRRRFKNGSKKDSCLNHIVVIVIVVAVVKERRCHPQSEINLGRRRPQGPCQESLAWSSRGERARHTRSQRLLPLTNIKAGFCQQKHASETQTRTYAQGVENPTGTPTKNNQKLRKPTETQGPWPDLMDSCVSTALVTKSCNTVAVALPGNGCRKPGVQQDVG